MVTKSKRMPQLIIIFVKLYQLSQKGIGTYQVLFPKFPKQLPIIVEIAVLCLRLLFANSVNFTH